MYFVLTWQLRSWKLEDLEAEDNEVHTNTAKGLLSAYKTISQLRTEPRQEGVRYV